MKKNLLLLTGIALLIAVLTAGGCSNAKKQKIAEDDENGMAKVSFAASDVDVFLKDTIILGTMHLLMSDSRKLECEVIDNHTIIIKGGYTVKWKKAQGSKIDRITHIRVVGVDSTFFGAVPEIDNTDVDTTEVFREGIHKLKIPEDVPTDTIVKYEIVFKVKHDTTSHTIDPYLKIPPEVDE